MAERWTRQRRLEHTRGLLLDAAEEVFAKQGLGGAALEDIAELAGFTRGAIYSRFDTKEDLFLAVIERHLQKLMDGFDDIIASFDEMDDGLIDELVARWRQLTSADPERAALNYEFSLYLLRNPAARERLAPQRDRMIRGLTDYITAHVDRLGGALQMPAETLARVLIASNEGIVMSSHIDGDDLYRPFMEFVKANLTAT